MCICSLILEKLNESSVLYSDVTKTGNGERGAGNGERKSGNELSAETSIKIQYGRSMIENRRNKLNRQRRYFS